MSSAIDGTQATLVDVPACGQTERPGASNLDYVQRDRRAAPLGYALTGGSP